LTGRHGRRFRTLAGADHVKGRAARPVAERSDLTISPSVVTAAIGDRTNDEELLASVDHPYLVARDVHSWADLDVPGLVRTPHPGPMGGSEAIQHLLATQRT